VKQFDQFSKNRVVSIPSLYQFAGNNYQMNITYNSIPKTYTDKIRQSMHDDFGHPVEVSIAGETGYGPCRCCLKQFQPGEKRLLFSYAPVNAANPYNEVGPVYIHEDCSTYRDSSTFPPEVKNGRLPIRLVLRCYNGERKMRLARFIKDNNDTEKIIRELFTDPLIEFIHIRNAVYQCFIAEVRRNQGTGS
jgi:hypothetical protein